ncbi:unnamed protein product [Mytilus coruscus]|uniref:Death domain-containing protein n=1 Tax=Mytilus coruscus TaxID=42192 RepID=A0A6J8EKT5_MYTCO|nr:unnamed protein product [Mytilus coruscus]
MGNCKGKISKESKSQMREEAYRPSDKGKVEGSVGDKLDNKNGINNEDAEASKIPFGTNTSVSGMNGLKANDYMKEQDHKQHEPEASFSENPVEISNKDGLLTRADTENDKHDKGEETNNESLTGIPLNKVLGSQSSDAETDRSYLFAHGRKEDEPQIEESEFINKKTGKSDDSSAHKDGVSSLNETGPTDKAMADASTTFNETSSEKEVDILPTDNAGGNDSEAVKGKSDQTNGHKNDQIGKHSDKSQPENAQSDNQQNNDDPTGYKGSKFAKLGDIQDKQISEEMKEMNSKKTKEKKKKKKSKFEPPPNANIQNYYEYAEVVNIGNDNVYMGHVDGKEKEEQEKVEKFQPTSTISTMEMEILVEVSKSVGYFHGPIKTGTCWRVGEDKIITAAHVVYDNIWNTVLDIPYEAELNNIKVDFDYISEQSPVFFKVEPKILFSDESLDVAVLRLIPDDRKPFPPPLKKFYRLNPKKDEDKHIYLISHNKSVKKEVNFGIGIWDPTEKRMEDLEKFCQKYEQQNGYIELDRKDRLVIQCEFVGGASGSPGIVILNNVAHVVFVYIRGFPSFYHRKQFPEEERRKFPRDKLLQQGVNIGNLYDAMSKGEVNLCNEIFHEEAKKREQNTKQHKLAITDVNSSNTDKTERSIDSGKDKMDNISSKSEVEIPISNMSKGTACTDQSEDKIPDAASYNRLMSHDFVPGQTYISSPEEDTDKYNNTGNQPAQNIETGGSDKCTVQDPCNHSSMNNGAAENHSLHVREKEIISLQRSPGKTRPVPVEQITIDEWIGREWQEHRYKQLADKDILFLSKAINPECFNSVALHFDLNQIDVAKIQTENRTDLCYHMLYKWKNKKGKDATLGKLIQNLFSSWISENGSVVEKELKLAILKVTEVFSRKE